VNIGLDNSGIDAQLATLHHVVLARNGDYALGSRLGIVSSRQSTKVLPNREPGLAAIYGGAFAAMELTTILNRCHHFRGFVYEHARFSTDKRSIEVVLRPRKGSAAVCSRCHLPAPGYDQLAERRFEFIPLWGFFVFLLYAMRRVDCRRCGVVAVEEVPWGDGKRTLTKAYMLFLARWARRLSWKETAECFRTSWDKVFDAVEHVVCAYKNSKGRFEVNWHSDTVSVDRIW
jgi:hypothetical protein